MKCKICKAKSVKSLCAKHLVQIRRYRFKIASMMYLGGKCIKCGENDISLLEFHHEGTNKEFNIALEKL